MAKPSQLERLDALRSLLAGLPWQVSAPVVMRALLAKAPRAEDLVYVLGREYALVREAKGNHA